MGLGSLFKKAGGGVLSATKFVALSPVKVVSFLVGRIPFVGGALSLAIDLGAMDWVLKLVARSMRKTFGLSKDTTDVAVYVASEAVKATFDATEKGELKTSEEKKKYAQDLWTKIAMSTQWKDELLHAVAIAPVLIQLVYDLQKVKKLYDQYDRLTVSLMMIALGARGLFDATAKPLTELLQELERVDNEYMNIELVDKDK